MEEEILFAEKQKFNQWWLWIMLLAINVLFGLGIYKQVIGGQIFGDKPMSNNQIIIGAVGTLIVTILFLIFRLETIVKKDGIYVRFFPIHFAFRKYTWDKIDKSFIRKYNPIYEYGGWGLRMGLFGKGKALNVSGNIGLQLILSNKRSLLIGTNKSKELEKVLFEIGQLNK
jgi:hypothetical protein